MISSTRRARRSRDAVDLRGRLSELRGRDAAAVAADLALELLLALERGRVLEPGRDELLHQRPHLLELGVRLLRREVTHDRNPMLRRVDAEAAQPRPHPLYVRLAFWVAFVGALAAVNYAARFSRRQRRRSRSHGVYSFSTFANGTTFYAVSLGIVLLICIHRFDLLALRRPPSWWRALGLGAGVVVAILVWEAVVSKLPLPESPGQEQGLANVHWEPKHAGRLRRQLLPSRRDRAVRRGADLPRRGQSLLRFLGRWPSIVLVGVAFGLAHGLVEALLVLVPFGMALAWLRDRTNSVVPGMFVHAFFNGAALVSIVVPLASRPRRRSRRRTGPA